MGDIEQHRRAVKVLELMDASCRAAVAGEEGWADLMDKATMLDPIAVSAIRVGWVIGEIPRPEAYPQEWAEYVERAREQLAERECSEGGEGNV